MSHLSRKPLICAALLMCLLLAVYAAGLSFYEVPDSRKGWIRELQFSTGALCWISASLIVITASRPRFLNLFIPLDSYYRLHKYLGITCAVLALLHFFAKDLGGPIISLLHEFNAQNAGAGPRGSGGYSLRAFAEDSGLYLTYLCLILFALTFAGKIPYRFWQRTHRLFPAIYLLLTLHCFVLIESYQLKSPLGLTALAVTILAWPCALKSLLNKAGSAKRHEAKLKAAAQGANYLRLDIENPIPKLKAGDFILLRIGNDNPHPYTAAQICADKITLFVRNKGAFAQKLKVLKADDSLIVEGPYGKESLKLPQASKKAVWLFQGAGMALLPHGLNKLKKNWSGQGELTIVLLARSSSSDELLTLTHDDLERAAGLPGIAVIRHLSLENGRISANKLKDICDGASIISCCAGDALKDSLSKLAQELKAEFYAEYTKWR